MLRLQASVQNYDWGRLGEESEVGRLYGYSSGKEVDQNIPYAELWMGTHPSGPSIIFDGHSKPEPLRDWLVRHQEALGQDVLKVWQGELPYLFKVLSVAKALSIQAHPDKKLAEFLHACQPHLYKDPNHKPEMALALTQFEALCGFISTQELIEVLQTVPEIKQLLKGHEVEKFLHVDYSGGTSEGGAQALREAFNTMITLDKESVVEQLASLVTRLKNEKLVRELTAKESLALVLEEQYPNDVGVIASFFLNYICLAPGEAVYLAANVPHAYISGECIECMATSDNVVRAGLTPKFRDTKILSSMLTYEQGLPEILLGSPVTPFIKRYSPPFHEFEVDRLDIPDSISLEFQAIPGPSIFLVFEGRGFMTVGAETSPLSKGDIFFLPAGQPLTLMAKSVQGEEVNGRWAGLPISAGESLTLFRAGVNSRFFLEVRAT